MEKIEVPIDLQKSKSGKHDKVRKEWSQQWLHEENVDW